MKLFVRLLVCSMFLLSLNAFAAHIVQITTDENGFPFFLDSDGHVWGARRPIDETLNDLVKIKNLEHIKKIAPFIAIDDQGRIFTWGIDENQIVQEGEGGDEAEAENYTVGYTPAKLFPGLSNVTLVAHSSNHFYAVVNNKDIYVWLELRKMPSLFGIERYGPIIKIYSREGVKAIAVVPESMYRWDTGDGLWALTALFNDGMIVGFNVNEYGQIVSEKDRNQPHPVVLGIIKNAVSIDMNEFHAAVLTADGHVKFWGGCDYYGENVRASGTERMWKYGHLRGVDSEITGVVGFALYRNHMISDNQDDDAFALKKGGVVLAHAPMPENTPEEACDYDSKRVNSRPHQIPNLDVDFTILQMAANGNLLYFLDTNHNLYVGRSDAGVKKVKLDLK